MQEDIKSTDPITLEPPKKLWKSERDIIRYMRGMLARKASSLYDCDFDDVISDTLLKIWKATKDKDTLLSLKEGYLSKALNSVLADRYRKEHPECRKRAPEPGHRTYNTKPRPRVYYTDKSLEKYTDHRYLYIDNEAELVDLEDESVSYLD